MALVTKDLREVTTKSSLLWGFAVATLAILFLDHFRETQSIPADWYWLLPLTAALSWGIIAAGLVSMAIPHVQHCDGGARRGAPPAHLWRAQLPLRRQVREGRAAALQGPRPAALQGAGSVEGLQEMVRQGLLDNDSLDRNAVMQHYMIPDTVWDLLDDPPKGWADDVAAGEVSWE